MSASRPIPDMSELDAAMREIHTLDWTPDRFFPISNRPVHYVSTAKIKRQVTPVLDKHGLRIAITMEDAPAFDGNIAVVRYRVCITDGRSEYQPATIYAEGVSAPGKRVIVSSTQAYRIYALSNLAIIDGMEDEQPQVNNNPQAQAQTLRPMKEDDPAAPAQADLLSGILRRAVTSAFRTVLTSPQVQEDVRKEARDRYDRIRSDADAKQFLEWKKEVVDADVKAFSNWAKGGCP